MKIVEFKDYDNQTTPLSAYNLNRLQQNLITTKYQMTFSSAVSGGSTITLPCYYQVGQDTLDVYLNSELLKKASTKDSEGHYYEVGNSDTKSNQIKITSDWSIASGDVLNLIVRGTTDSYDQNLSPDKATQLADEISANKEEITNLRNENSYLQNVVKQAFKETSANGTELTIDNTIEARMDLKLKGNTSQQQYSVKEGSTATSYEPYTGGIPTPNPEYPQEIHCVKGNNVVTISNGNVLPNNLSDGTMNGITYTINGDKSINLSGTATSRVEPKLYDGAGYTIRAGVYKNTTSYRIIGYTGPDYMTFGSNVSTNLTKDVTFKQLYFRIESGATVNETIYPQIILSSKTDTSYVPHEETEYKLNLGNIELNSIGTFKDYFVKIGDKWYKVEKIKSIIADGTNYLCKYMFSNGTFFIYSNAEKSTLRDALKTSDISLFSNYLISKTYTAVFNNGEIGAIYNISTGEIGVNIGISTNKEDINAWLTTHNLMIKYILQTPNKIEITDTTLINQLDEISQALSKKGTTIISQSNDDLPFNLDVITLTK